MKFEKELGPCMGCGHFGPVVWTKKHHELLCNLCFCAFRLEERQQASAEESDREFLQWKKENR